jgi:hypothetical protein
LIFNFFRNRREDEKREKGRKNEDKKGKTKRERVKKGVFVFVTCLIPST